MGAKSFWTSVLMIIGAAPITVGNQTRKSLKWSVSQWAPPAAWSTKLSMIENSLGDSMLS